MAASIDALSLLRERGLVAQVSDETGVASLLNSDSTSVYIGFDPTAASLHVGHLLPVMVLARLQRMGHRPIVLVGGATGMIGDPSGKSSERELLTPAMVSENVRGVRSQLERFVEFGGENGATIVDNNDWISSIAYVDWLREVGKHFSINYMLTKESVRKRLEEREQGISYTEFSYMLMQAFDFRHLFDNFNCRMQGGGNDQWGNITAGIEFIRKTRRQEAYGITFPLMTTSNGQKFGKSEGNAIWLDPGLTSPYRFYQYWLQSDDRDVARYLRCFTFLDMESIEELMSVHQMRPEERRAQRTLAKEITRAVHGEAGLESAQRATSALFGSGLERLSEDEISDVFSAAPSYRLPRHRLGEVSITDLLVESGTCKSRSEVRQLAKQGGVYLNGTRLEEAMRSITPDDLLSGGRLMVLRTGKRKHLLIRFLD